MLKAIKICAVCLSFSGCGNPALKTGVAAISSEDAEKKVQMEAAYVSAQNASQLWQKVTFDPVSLNNLKKEDLAFLASGGEGDKSHFLTNSASEQYAAPGELGPSQAAARVEPFAGVAAQDGEKTILVGESAWFLSASSIGFASKSMSEGKVAVRYPLGVNLEAALLNNFESVVGRYESALFLQHQKKILIVEVDRSVAERAALSVNAFELPKQLWDDKLISVGRTNSKGRFWLITKKGMWVLAAAEDLKQSTFASFPLEQLKKYPDLKFVSGVLVGNDLLPQDYLLGWSPAVGAIKIWLKPRQ